MSYFEPVDSTMLDCISSIIHATNLSLLMRRSDGSFASAHSGGMFWCAGTLVIHPKILTDLEPLCDHLLHHQLEGD
ncbi:hypothetical protein [Bradyrhizobium sp. Arg816]|uniref:hypothetical protein n=1 Tax=Bradyrhizobium sp. Arg816 TaxID=2998491 RepID=UPI00249E8DD0|nr:hypothetical protein [Bradyrhizobium sp. Arg816]MDI3566657.1 hypothetical protein [Bradyrhizobium sp. Arg816]